MYDITRYEHLEYPVEKALMEAVSDTMKYRKYDLVLSLHLTQRDPEHGQYRYEVVVAKCDEEHNIVKVGKFVVRLIETGRDVWAEVVDCGSL